ncbi:hypothetical protein [Methyloglobulus morosus]|nr:hypothetical protein [Methyloglobulus morosus]
MSDTKGGRIKEFLSDKAGDGGGQSAVYRSRIADRFYTFPGKQWSQKR